MGVPDLVARSVRAIISGFVIIVATSTIGDLASMDVDGTRMDGRA